jgi:autotransporter passenger strand-loop-strand repeat protein
MTVTVVVSGQIASGSLVTAGNELLVSSGGSAVSIHIGSGGTQLLAASPSARW